MALLISLLGPRTLLSLHLVFYVSFSCVHYHRSFSSVGKESACNAGDLSLIPGWGRAAGEGISYPPQYSWASLVVQLLKNLPAMWETWVRSLGREHPLEKGTATYSRILAWRIPWVVQTMGLQRVRHDWATFTLTFTDVEFSFLCPHLGCCLASCFFALTGTEYLNTDGLKMTGCYLSLLTQHPVNPHLPCGNHTVLGTDITGSFVH